LVNVRTVVLLALLMTGCGAKKAFKAGFQSETAGDTWRAAQLYLEALDKRATHEDSKVGLDRIGEDALMQAVGFAEREEADEDFLAAMQWYQEMQRYTRRLERFNHLGFPVTVDFDDKIGEMRSAAAFEAYSDGDDAVRARRWEQAIGFFKAAQQIVPSFKDTDGRIAAAHYGWAEDEVASGQFRSAAVRFTQAVTGEEAFEDSAIRSLELFAALGRHHLATGTCRQAVRDLRVAHIEFPNELGAELHAAEECAHRTVEIASFTGGGRVAGVVVDDWVEGYVLREFPAASSEFIDLVASGDRKSVTADFEVRGAINEAWLRRPEPATSARSVSGSRIRACREGELPTPCLESIPVTYLEHTSVVQARVEASIRVVASENGRFIGQAQPVGENQSTRHWADTFADTNGNAAPVAATPTESLIGIGEALITLRDAQQTHPADAEIFRYALAIVGRDAVSSIVGAVDTEEPVRDPSSLTVLSIVGK
jgi:tetratricopeptide (TPR) repeat protein